MHGADYSVTRGHSLRLSKCRCKYDLRKYNFCNRVVNVWNSLPISVISEPSVNCFRSQMDNFWKNQDIIYDFRAEIYGTGNRREM